MDLFQVSAYFDSTHFLVWDFDAQTWVQGFEGQIKRADNFVSIWNRPTRKRMLYAQIDTNIESSVVKVEATGEIFMLGSSQDDAHLNKGYRKVLNAHEAYGSAVISRKQPTLVGGVRSYAEDIVVETTFGDYELRATDRLSDDRLLGYGEYFLFLPSNSTVRDLDTVLIGGIRFYVYEVYKDSGFVTCRATSKGDDRIDFQYVSLGSPTYNPSTQTVTPTETVYGSTGRVIPNKSNIDSSSTVAVKSLKIIFREDFISYVPKPNDFVIFRGLRYKVRNVALDSLLQEYEIEVYA
jgi:hypothetical protein